MLLGYLSCHRGRPVDRGRLTEALWPTGAPDSAADALTTLVSRLRSAIDPLEIDGRSTLRLMLPERSSIDLELAREALHEAQAAIATGRWTDAWAPSRAALHVANRELLPGLEAPWIDEQRRDLEQIGLAALECVGRAGLGIGGPELPAAERSGRRLVRRAPFHEPGHRLLIEALARSGNRGEAALAYERLRTSLRDELGIAPSEETQELHRRLIG